MGGGYKINSCKVRRSAPRSRFIGTFTFTYAFDCCFSFIVVNIKYTFKIDSLPIALLCACQQICNKIFILYSVGFLADSRTFYGKCILCSCIILRAQLTCCVSVYSIRYLSVLFIWMNQSLYFVFEHLSYLKLKFLTAWSLPICPVCPVRPVSF